MKAPGKEAARHLLQAAHDARRCCVPNGPTQRRLLNRAVACGIATRPAPGIFADAAQWQELNAEERLHFQARALSITHPSWVFAGTTAAAVHGLKVSFSRFARLCRIAGPASHRTASAHMDLIRVRGDKPVMRDGVHVTSFLRTVFDCLRTLPFPEALALADSALRSKAITRRRLSDNIARIYSQEPHLQRVIDIIELADGRSENGGESMARAQMISLGFAAPQLQRMIPDPLDPSHSYRQDFVWELDDGTLVVGELDGRDKYVDPGMLRGKDTVDVLLAERRRESRLTLQKQPVRVMRFSFAESQDRRLFSKLLSSYGVPRADVVPSVALG